MDQQEKGGSGIRSGGITLKLVIALMAVALIMALAWWGYSVYKGSGTPQALTPEPRPAAQEPAPPTTPAETEKAVEKGPDKETVQEADTGMVEPLTVHFMYRSYYLHKAQMADIRRFIASLGSLDGLEFHVDAYTCSKGSRDYNQYLSKERASAVVRYLKAKGVPPSAITMAYHGESDPLASNKTREGRKQNRRATISVKALR